VLDEILEGSMARRLSFHQLPGGKSSRILGAKRGRKRVTKHEPKGPTFTEEHEAPELQG